MDPDTFKAVVLNAAIQGKLVPQDPNDEPASVLVERIREERQKMIKEGKNKKDKADSFIFKRDNHYYENIAGVERFVNTSIPFDIPNSWVWMRGESLFDNQQTAELPYEFLYIDIDSIDNHNCIIDHPRLVKKHDAPSRAKRQIHEGDVLFSLVRPYLKNIALVTEKYANAIASTGFFVCSPRFTLYPRYLYYLMTSDYVINGINEKMKGDNSPSVRREDMLEFFYPIPPLVEQKRICQAIEELLKIARIHDALLNSSRLFSKTLAQSIIMSAIQGKLVPQDPKDPLVQIQCKNPIVRRDNSYYETNGQKQQCIDDEIPFTIPEKWTWYRLKDVCQYGSSETIRVSEIPSNAKIIELDNIEKNTGRLIGYTSLSTITPTSTHHVFKKGDVLYSKLRPYLNKVVIAEEDGYCTTEIVVIKPNSVLLNKYLQLFLMSPIFINRATHISYGDKMPRLGTKDGKDTLIPVPPYSEQVRIVSKYEQLKELTNQLSC